MRFGSSPNGETRIIEQNCIFLKQCNITLIFAQMLLSVSLFYPPSSPLGELIHFDGVEWPCKCWTQRREGRRRKRRRCKLVASDQISSLLTAASLPSILSPFLQCPKRIMATVKENPLVALPSVCGGRRGGGARTDRYSRGNRGGRQTAMQRR